MPMLTPLAAARKASFWTISSPPSSARWTGTIRPGYGAPKATRRLPAARFWKTVMKSDSPVSRRLPAPISAPMKPPPCCCAEPSPKMVSISTPSSMYIIPPASATTASCGSSSTSTYCMSSPKIL